jgi:ClpP class serine protease
MDFDNAYSFVLDFAFSAGTILALMPNKIVGFPNAHVGPVDPQMIVAGPQGITSVIGAMTVKRLIEEVLPQLAIQQGIGKEGLTRLYAAQDLYEKALESIKYIEDIFSDKICKNHKKMRRT